MTDKEIKCEILKTIRLDDSGINDVILFKKLASSQVFLNNQVDISQLDLISILKNLHNDGYINRKADEQPEGMILNLMTSKGEKLISDNCF